MYRLNTTSGLDLNLQRCSGCARSGWGWIGGTPAARIVPWMSIWNRAATAATTSVGISPSEWLNDTVNVGASGTYTLTLRVASAGPGGTLHLEVNGANVSGSVTIPDTGGPGRLANATRTVTLSAGSSRQLRSADGELGRVRQRRVWRLPSFIVEPVHQPRDRRKRDWMQRRHRESVVCRAARLQRFPRHAAIGEHLAGHGRTHRRFAARAYAMRPR